LAHRFATRSRVVARALRERTVHPVRRRPSVVERILVAHHLLLGDTLMLTPLLATLRARYPRAQIVMTTPIAFVPLYAGRPYGVHAIPFDPRRPETLDTVFAAGPFDLAYVPGDNRFSWLALAAGARWIVAFGGDRPPHKSWPVDELRPYPDAPAAWGDMVAGLVDDIRAPAFALADWPAPASRPFVRPTPADYAVLHVGASTPLKQWGPDRWRELAHHLRAAHGLSPVFLAGPGETPIIDAIDPDLAFARYPGNLDLAQVWQLLARADLLICPDTGVAHLGRIVGVPTVTLFGPGSAIICGAGDFWRDAPWRGVTVADFACRDQRVLFKRTIPWVRRCGRSTRECAGARCMAAIAPSMAAIAISDLLAVRGTRPGEPSL